MQVIKVLGVTKKGSGSHFHRIDVLKKIHNVEIENKKIEVDIKEFDISLIQDMKNYDIVVYHWDIPMQMKQIGELQNKNVKFIYSIDDWIDFPENHPYYNNIMVNYNTKVRVKSHLVNSDCVIVTTDRLAMNCGQYNNYIAINPNFLDVNDYNLQKTESDKLRVGIVGSISHLPDYELLKGAINRFSKNKDIVENCVFYICGYVKNDPLWEKVIKLFSVKKNLKLELKEALTPDKYMELYNEIDVCLVPLQQNEFNSNKSAIKLAECLISKTIPVGSILYLNKELKGIVVAEQPIHYEETIFKLIDKEYRKKVLDHISEINEKDNDYKLRFENLAKIINTVYSEDLSPKFKRNINLNSIIYKENQTSLFDVYDNSFIKTPEQKSWRFEYNPIIDILSNDLEEKEYTGIFSYKFTDKTGFTKNILIKSLNKYKYWEYDFINLSRKQWKNTKEYLDFSYKQHPKLEELLKKVINNLGKEFKYDRDNYCYSNFFIMKTDLYKDYVNNWIIPTLNFLENEIWEEVNIDANYQSNLSKEEFKELTGLDFYNYVTFILERLIVFYMYDKNLKVLNTI